MPGTYQLPPAAPSVAAALARVAALRPRLPPVAVLLANRAADARAGRVAFLALVHLMPCQGCPRRVLAFRFVPADAVLCLRCSGAQDDNRQTELTHG